MNKIGDSFGGMSKVLETVAEQAENTKPPEVVYCEMIGGEYTEERLNAMKEMSGLNNQEIGDCVGFSPPVIGFAIKGQSHEELREDIGDLLKALIMEKHDVEYERVEI